jgi:hypothetical protein
LADRLAPIIAERVTLPALHLSLLLNLGTFGDDDQTHHPADFTVSDIVNLPPSAVRWLVGIVAVLAAFASEGTANTASATTAIRRRRSIRMSDLPRSLLHRGYRLPVLRDQAVARSMGPRRVHIDRLTR